MEILYTSLGALRNKDYSLKAQTSAWMFPIYGLAAIIEPVYGKIKDKHVLVRGGIYTVGIFTCEYLTGSLLKKLNMCPWDYSKEHSNINGLIRLDYAPLWMMAGLAFEKILTRDSE